MYIIKKSLWFHCTIAGDVNKKGAYHEEFIHHRGGGNRLTAPGKKKRRNDIIWECNKKAFTLAEVLITLGIIGVVAALTMPSMIANHQKMVLSQQFKKSYSVLQQSWKAAENNLGDKPYCFYWENRPYPSSVCLEYNDVGICIRSEMPDGTPVPADFGGRFEECSMFMTQLEKELHIIKKCANNSLNNGCIPKYKGLDTYYKEQDDTLTEDLANQMTRGCSSWSQDGIDNRVASYVLADGSIIMLYSGPQLFAMDINGKKGPNKWGYDLFNFGTRSNLGATPLKVVTNLSCNPIEKGGLSTSSMLLNAYK